MNSTLKKLYLNNWNILSEKLNELILDNSKEIKPTNPLLIYVDEEKYLNADIRIMIIGQETNDWEGNFQKDIDYTLDLYNNFLNNNSCFSYGGQFWNGYNRFLSLLQNKYPQKKIASIWNNVIKIGNSGRHKNKSLDYIYSTERDYFNILKDEIEILKPNIILFLSGPNYDNEIKHSLENITFNSFSEKYTSRALSKIEFNNHLNIYRTYHPNYLWRNNIDSFFNEIIEDITL